MFTRLICSIASKSGPILLYIDSISNLVVFSRDSVSILSSGGGGKPKISTLRTTTTTNAAYAVSTATTLLLVGIYNVLYFIVVTGMPRKAIVEKPAKRQYL